MSHVIPFPDFGKAEPELGPQLPIVLDGPTEFACVRCGARFTAPTWHLIDLPGGWPICTNCGYADASLLAWAVFCEAADSIDAALMAAATRRDRQLIADMLHGVVIHFANWRSSDGDFIDPCRQPDEGEAS